jgi:hypothetical protein
MEVMKNAVVALDEFDDLEVVEDPDSPRWSRQTPRTILRAAWRRIGSAVEWVFGLACLVLGLAVLAAVPLVQLLSLGYLLESSARVARSGRLRDGLIGVRPAARIGGAAWGTCLSLAPAWLVSSLAYSAELIDPGGSVARGWRSGLVIVTVLSLFHIAAAFLRGGRIRYFLWPVGNLFWLARRWRAGGLYTEVRDGFWYFATALRLPHYFRLGGFGALGTLGWLLPPAFLMALGGRAAPVGILGALVLAIVAPWLPFLQVRFVVEGRFSALFGLRAVRDRFRRAPWAFAFSLLVLLLASIPLYLLKIQIIPRDAIWLESLVFVLFLAPARLLTGWAYARSGRRERPRHWVFRSLGRIAILPAALFYVLVVFLAQYTSWGGVNALYEQHAFLLPVPFLNM